MFYGHCLHPADGSWTPPISLATASACYSYCALHSSYISEIRMTDEEDFVVLLLKDRVFHIPQPNQTMKELPLTPELLAYMRAGGAGRDA